MTQVIEKRNNHLNVIIINDCIYNVVLGSTLKLITNVMMLPYAEFDLIGELMYFMLYRIKITHNHPYVKMYGAQKQIQAYSLIHLANICERSPLCKAPYLQINQKTSVSLHYLKTTERAVDRGREERAPKETRVSETERAGRDDKDRKMREKTEGE